MRGMEATAHAKTGAGKAHLSRRGLLGAAAVAAALPATLAQAGPVQDSEWSRLLTALDGADAASYDAAAAEENHEAPVPPQVPPPPELTVWSGPCALELRGERHEVPGYHFTFTKREDLAKHCAKHPQDAAGRLEAWDRWQEGCRAAERTSGYNDAKAAHDRVLAASKAAWRARCAAFDAVLAHPTLDPRQLYRKLELVDEHGEGLEQVLDSLQAALAKDA